MKLTQHMQVIVDYQGCVVPGLGNSGKGYGTGGQTSSNWGGKRTRSLLPTTEHWIHPDAISCRNKVVEEAIVKYESNTKKGQANSGVSKEEEMVDRVIVSFVLEELLAKVVASAGN